MLSLLFTFNFLTVFVHHIHSGPIGAYLHVSAGLIFLDSFPAFFLSMILPLLFMLLPGLSLFIICSGPAWLLLWLLFLGLVPSEACRRWNAATSLLSSLSDSLSTFTAVIAIQVLELLLLLVLVAMQYMSYM